MKLQRSICVLFLAFLSVSCEDGFKFGPFGDKGYDNSPIKEFNLELFEQNLITAVGNQWDGYAYAINQNGRLMASGASGFWLKNSLPADITTPIYAASVNKFIAAVGALKIMEESGGINQMVNNSISGYLPPSWTKSSFIQGVTVHEMLTHSSGIPTAFNSDYTTLRNISENGVGVPATGTTYSNANFGLLRMFIAAVNGTSFWGDDAQMENAGINGYLNYMSNEIFDVIEISPQVEPSTARYYQWGSDVTPWDIGNRQANLASGGFYISVYDLAKLLAYVNHTEEVISNEAREIMFDNFYGLLDGNPPATDNGDYGMYYTKAGSLGSNGRGMRSIIMIFPNGVEMVFIANSRGGNMDGTVALRNAVIQAFDDAWE